MTATAMSPNGGDRRYEPSYHSASLLCSKTVCKTMPPHIKRLKKLGFSYIIIMVKPADNAGLSI
jgi:hypothetical protein